MVEHCNYHLCCQNGYVSKDCMKTPTNLSKMPRQILIRRVQMRQLCRLIGISFIISTRQFPLPFMKEDWKSGGIDRKMWNYFHAYWHEYLPLLWPYKVKLYFYTISPPFPFHSPLLLFPPFLFYFLYHRKWLEWPQEEKTIDTRTATFWQQRVCNLG